jgi:hypothetical protein
MEPEPEDEVLAVPDPMAASSPTPPRENPIDEPMQQPTQGIHKNMSRPDYLRIMHARLLTGDKAIQETDLTSAQIIDGGRFTELFNKNKDTAYQIMLPDSRDIQLRKERLEKLFTFLKNNPKKGPDGIADVNSVKLIHTQPHHVSKEGTTLTRMVKVAAATVTGAPPLYKNNIQSVHFSNDRAIVTYSAQFEQIADDNDKIRILNDINEYLMDNYGLIVKKQRGRPYTLKHQSGGRVKTHKKRKGRRRTRRTTTRRTRRTRRHTTHRTRRTTTHRTRRRRQTPRKPIRK